MNLDFTDENTSMRVGSKPVIGIKLGSKEWNFHSWRFPKTADIIGGKIIKIVPPASPIVIPNYEGCFYNNNYLTCSGPYRIQELNSYDTESAAEDYSWVINIFTAGLYIYDSSNNLIDTLYKSTSRVKITYDSSGNPTYTQLSSSEDIKKTEWTCPSDFGYVLTYGGSNESAYGFGSIDLKVDDYDIEQKPYHLEYLSATDDLKNKYVIIPSLPSKFENVLYPSGPDTSLQYTLFAEDYYDETTYESASEMMYAFCYGTVSGYDETTYEPIYVAPYYFSFVLDTQGSSTVICYTQFDSDPVYWNRSIIIGGESVSLPLSHLDTTSPLYSYIQKIVWD